MYSDTLCRMNLKSGLPARCSILSVLPVIKLSMAMTLNPSASNRSLKWEPRNPAPPVTTAVFLLDFVSNMNTGLHQKSMSFVCRGINATPQFCAGTYGGCPQHDSSRRHPRQYWSHDRLPAQELSRSK